MTSDEDPRDRVLTDRIVSSLPPAWSRRQKWMVNGLFWLAALAVAAAVFAMLRVQSASTRADHAETDAHRAGSQVTAEQAQLSAANSAIARLGGTPVPIPGPTGATGPAASDTQVQNAVDSYLAEHPVPAPVIDYGQVHAFVIAWLAQHPAPSGPAGKPGATGPQGATGATGPAGANATDQQVQDAVDAYMAAHPPQSGPPGPTGPAGQPPVSWTWTYTDQLGQQHQEQCVRSANFDPANPTYTCTDVTPSPSPSLPGKGNH